MANAAIWRCGTICLLDDTVVVRDRVRPRMFGKAEWEMELELDMWFRGELIRSLLSLRSLQGRHSLPATALSRLRCAHEPSTCTSQLTSASHVF